MRPWCSQTRHLPLTTMPSGTVNNFYKQNLEQGFAPAESTHNNRECRHRFCLSYKRTRKFYRGFPAPRTPAAGAHKMPLEQKPPPDPLKKSSPTTKPSQGA